MSKNRTSELTAWEAVKIVEKSYKLKEAFFDWSIKAAQVDLKAAERVRRDLKEGKISIEEAIQKFKKIAGES